MNWDLNNLGISTANVKIYDSPFSTSDSKLAFGGSKINNSVAQKQFSSESITKKLNLERQSVPVVNKNQTLRFQLNAEDITNFKPGAEMMKREMYRQTLRKYSEKFSKFNKEKFIVDDVDKSIAANMNAILSSKIITEANAPIWFVIREIYIAMIEIMNYNNKNKSEKSSSPIMICDVLYQEYGKIDQKSEKIPDNYNKQMNELSEEIRDFNIPHQHFLILAKLNNNFNKWLHEYTSDVVVESIIETPEIVEEVVEEINDDEEVDNNKETVETPEIVEEDSESSSLVSGGNSGSGESFKCKSTNIIIIILVTIIVLSFVTLIYINRQRIFKMKEVVEESKSE